MKMNIEEKTKNFLELLKSCFIAQGEKIEISGVILKVNDLNLRELREIICPRLEKEGILKSYFSGCSRVISNDNSAEWSNLNLELGLAQAEYARSFHFCGDVNDARKKMEEAEARINKYLDLQEWIYEFEVDGSKLVPKELNIGGIDPKALKVAEYYITKDSEGNYWRDGQLINISNKDTLYFVIFDVVYGLAKTGGEINYSDIENNLRKRMVNGRKVESLDGQKRNKRILARVNEFFKMTKTENVVQDGRKLIEPKGRRGKQIKFNNRK